MYSEGNSRQGRNPYDTSVLANTELVFSSDGVFDRQTSAASTQTEVVNNTLFRQDSSVNKSDSFDGLSNIRTNYENQGISKEATQIIFASWRGSTKKQYAHYIRRWIRFCDKRKIDSLCPTIAQVLDFLTVLFQDGMSYSALNSTRSALSAYGIVINGTLAG